MFYCEDCRIKNEYPESFSGSMGSCELCGTSTICHDVPSTALPKGDSLEQLNEFVDDIVNKMRTLSHSSQIITLTHIADELSLDKTATAIRDSLNK